MLAYAPGNIPAGLVVEDMIQNIDIAPTILSLAGKDPKSISPEMDGISFEFVRKFVGRFASSGSSQADDRTKRFIENFSVRATVTS